MGLILTILVALLVFVPSVEAAAPSLPLDRADRAATRWAHEEVAAWSEWYDADGLDEDGVPIDPTDDPGASVYIAAYALDLCERVGNRRAECDVTYLLNDGTLCDDIIEIRGVRGGHVNIDSYGPCANEDY